MKHLGSCHCGNIRFEVEGEIESVLRCNCSICSKRGYLLWFVDRANLKLLTPEANLTTYTFNKHHIKHNFCAKCGCAPYGEADSPEGQAMAAVNVNCLDTVKREDLSAMPTHDYDGRSK